MDATRAAYMTRINLIVITALTFAHTAFPQGTVAFYNRAGTTTTAPLGQVVAPIYGCNPADPTRRMSGNGPGGVPMGSTDWGNTPYLHNDATHTYVATLWALKSPVV